METIRTTATVRVMLSHAYCNFEVALTLENPEGITDKDIEAARKDAQAEALAGVNEYKANPSLKTDQELKRIKGEVDELKKMMGKTEPEPDPDEIAAIASLPQYQAPEKPSVRKSNKSK